MLRKTLGNDIVSIDVKEERDLLHMKVKFKVGTFRSKKKKKRKGGLWFIIAHRVERYSLLHLLNFLVLSKWKLQEEATGEITFYMKGADVAMASIVQYNDWLEEEVRVKFYNM